MNPTIHQLQEQLGQSVKQPAFKGDAPQAAVALILHPSPGGLELLFIERSQRKGDPWSGHLAFPGGRLEPHDAGPRAAAERETHEEIGLVISPHQCLGPLNPLKGVALPVSVAAFVYAIESPTPFQCSDEVSEVFWTPLSNLQDTARQTKYVLAQPDGSQSFEALRILPAPRPVLWGITYRFVQQLLGFLKS